MCKINTINIHFLDMCNYICKHCFVKKEQKQLNFEQIKIIVDKISLFYAKEGIRNGRINLAGGEPLLSKDIDQIIDYIYQKGLKVSLITNGYYLTKEFINRHKKQLCTIGISVDSLNDDTNKIIGRCQLNGKNLEQEKLILMCKYIKSKGIKLKINTCVSKLNYEEDFTYFLREVKPDRYKVLQMLCDDFDIINAKNRINEEEMNLFIKKHKKYITVKESSEEMKKSYLIVDSSGNLSCDNMHQSSYSVFENEISDILEMLNINENYFERRYNHKYQLKVINQ